MITESDLARVVRKVDNTIHWIDRYPAVDKRYPAFKDWGLRVSKRLFKYYILLQIDFQTHAFGHPNTCVWISIITRAWICSSPGFKGRSLDPIGLLPHELFMSLRNRDKTRRACEM